MYEGEMCGTITADVEVHSVLWSRLATVSSEEKRVVGVVKEGL